MSAQPEMDPGQLAILDLRHYSAASLRPLLEAENRVWAERMAWDYRTSTDLLLQYLDARILPGFVAVTGGSVVGYTFCVYEERKAVIGDVFALPESHSGHTQTEIEAILLKHLLEMLQNSPGTDRIESQLLLHTHDMHAQLFKEAGFSVHERIFMDLALHEPRPEVPGSWEQMLASNRLLLRSWREEDFNPAGSLIANAYEGHMDAVINDQYRTVAGSLRFLHNIIRFPGCGVFDALSSHVLEHRGSGALAGLVLCSRVRADVEHVTQLCVTNRSRGLGLGALLLEAAIRMLAQRGFGTLSLTATDGNERALALYARAGFQEKHRFNAMVWTRQPIRGKRRTGVFNFGAQPA